MIRFMLLCLMMVLPSTLFGQCVSCQTTAPNEMFVQETVTVGVPVTKMEYRQETRNVRYVRVEQDFSIDCALQAANATFECIDAGGRPFRCLITAGVPAYFQCAGISRATFRQKRQAKRAIQAKMAEAKTVRTRYYPQKTYYVAPTSSTNFCLTCN